MGRLHRKNYISTVKLTLADASKFKTIQIDDSKVLNHLSHRENNIMFILKICFVLYWEFGGQLCTFLANHCFYVIWYNFLTSFSSLIVIDVLVSQNKGPILVSSVLCLGF